LALGYEMNLVGMGLASELSRLEVEALWAEGPRQKLRPKLKLRSVTFQFVNQVQGPEYPCPTEQS